MIPLFDASSNSGYQAATSTPIPWAHVNAGNFLAVDVSLLSVAGTTVSSVTYNGVAMTLIGVKSSVSGACRVECWGLVAPAAGSHNIVVTLSAAAVSASNAVSYSGVNQTTPYESFVSAQATNVGAADATVDVTPFTWGGLVHAAVASDDGSVTANLVTRNNVTGALGSGANEDAPACAGMSRMSYTGVGAAATWVIAAYAINPTTIQQAIFDSKDFNTSDTSTGSANNTTSCQGLKDVAGGVGQISSNKLKLNGTNYQTAPIRNVTTVLNGGVRAKITQSSSLSGILQARSQSNNAGFWTWLNAHITMTTATSGGTAGSFPVGAQTIADGDYIMELTAQQVDTSHTTVTAKLKNATTLAILDLLAYVDATAALINSSSVGISGGLLNPSFADDMAFFTTPAVSSRLLNITCVGDSLTLCTGSSAGLDYPTQMGNYLGGYCTVNNNGVSGDKISDLVTRAAATDATKSGTKRNVLVVAIGTNDMLASPAHSAATTYADLSSYCLARYAAGWNDVFVTLIIDRSEAGLSSNWTTNAPLLNNLILKNAVADGICNGVIGTDSRFMAGSGESAGTTNYNGDHIHLKDLSYGIRASYASEFLRGYFNTLPPAAPTGLSLDLGSSETQVTWNDQAADSYQLYRGLLANHSDTALLASPVGGSAAYDDFTTYSSVHYYYRLRAVNTNGNSAFTDIDGVAAGPLSSSASGFGFSSIRSPGVFA